MSANSGQRLSKGGRINRQQTLQFTFNGRSYQGLAGDTLASALLANGVKLVARSWKYHRPRGILSAGVEEPNALVQLFDGARTVPNARMTEVSLVNGLTASSIHAKPSIEFDLGSVNSWFSRLIPAGFYYKTFMSSQKAWHFFEHHIRKASGLGESPTQADPDRYDKRFAFCDVLVVGGGLAGLSAALAAGATGARVIFADEQAEMGGWLLSSDAMVDGMPAAKWVESALLRLKAMPEVKVMSRTTVFGYMDHNLLALAERRTDHLASPQATARERLWKVRAKQVVLATGAHERPLVFSNNDLPGIMLASAVSTYIRRYAVLPGKRAVVFTNNDHGYDAAFALKDAGAAVTVVDARATPDGDRSTRARQQGIQILAGHVVVEATGGKAVTGVNLYKLNNAGALAGSAGSLPCDLLAMSGGFSPVIHLHCQSSSKPIWNDDQASFHPGKPVQPERSAGACHGIADLAGCASDGVQAGLGAAQAAGLPAADIAVPSMAPVKPGSLRPLWEVPHPKPSSRAPKKFVDLQNDVGASDVHLAVREGFESIEHLKRYTAMGFGTDQGKTGNINGMGIAAGILGRSIPQVGTTTFRPNYTPVTFGLIAVGTLDGSTLGKIDIQGPDATVLLNWMYSNAWSKLEIGKCRYGLMLDENGMVFDDGVTVRLSENHYLMHTTTGGAARVLAWMERWLQTEWPDLKVYLTSATDHWATSIVAGPKSRHVLKKICQDIDFDDAAFPFMSYREGTIAGVPTRIMRISFSGERSYEVNVAAQDGLRVWEAIHAAGAEFGITPYGTETMHVLRAEKGYIIIGQDTDGSITPFDLGMGGLVTKTKDCLGKRSLARADTLRPDRKQLVGLLTDDPMVVLPEGAQITNSSNPVAMPIPMVGHVTSSYMSPTIGRSVAMALVKGGLSRMTEAVYLPLADGRTVKATICSPVFYDPKSERQNA